MTEQEAIERIKNDIEINHNRLADEYITALEMAIQALEQKKKHGKWVDDDNSFYANCSKCGYQIDTHEERGYHNFCPNCGARME